MMRWVLVCAFVLLALPVAPGNSYLTGEGDLAAQLTLREAQSGFAGETGTIWAIETSGRWVESTFLNKKVEQKREGKLEKKHLQALAKALDDNKLKELPKEFGKKVGANPHTYALTFGDKKSELQLNGGEDILKAKGVKDTTSLKRFATIVQAIRDAVPPAEQEDGRKRYGQAEDR